MLNKFFWPQLRDRLLYGGRLRARVLVKRFSNHYRSLFRGTWAYSPAEQMFEIQRGEWFSLGFDEIPNSIPAYFARGFFAAEIIRPGDKILDIGCGDGFFTKRFYALSGGEVDGIDLEPNAIRDARRFNGGPGIRYFQLNAFESSFPRNQYDVIVWDGALGHFPESATKEMLDKIVGALASDGVFIGSESLGREDHGHQQFFDTLDELADLFRPYFTWVSVKQLNYKINAGMHQRLEGYWRCSKRRDRLEAVSWQEKGQKND